MQWHFPSLLHRRFAPYPVFSTSRTPLEHARDREPATAQLAIAPRPLANRARSNSAPPTFKMVAVARRIDTILGVDHHRNRSWIEISEECVDRCIGGQRYAP